MDLRYKYKVQPYKSKEVKNVKDLIIRHFNSDSLLNDHFPTAKQIVDLNNIGAPKVTI